MIFSVEDGRASNKPNNVSNFKDENCFKVLIEQNRTEQNRINSVLKCS